MQHPGSWYLPWGVPLQKMVAVPIHPPGALHLQHPPVHVQPVLAGLPAPLTTLRSYVTQPSIRQPQRKIVIDLFISFQQYLFLESVDKGIRQECNMATMIIYPWMA
ncbi:hypothetical protein FQR65_LT17837 [Abscondita terminalis]|nr:hypothetical protein FQR65_LT17837 [Abscondita terminalis]